MTTATAGAGATTYHLEDGIWWVEDTRLPGFTAVGNTLAEVSQLLAEALAHLT